MEGYEYMYLVASLVVISCSAFVDCGYAAWMLGSLVKRDRRYAIVAFKAAVALSWN